MDGGELSFFGNGSSAYNVSYSANLEVTAHTGFYYRPTTRHRIRAIQ